MRKSPETSSTTELGFTFDSPEDLARGFLQALRTKNVPRLKRFALTEREFREFVWPQLPASQPRTNLPVEYAWAELNQKSLSSLAMTFSRYGGRKFELLGVRFRDKTTDYDVFLVHRDAGVLVRDELGNVLSLAIFGSILETEGAYKLFSYRVD